MLFGTVAVVTAALAACGSEPPALTVGDVFFTETALLGLSEDRRERLVEITALAIAVNRDELVERASALRDRAVSRSIVDALRVRTLLESEEVGDDVLETRYQTEPEYELTVRHFVLLADRGLGDVIREEARRKAEAGLARVQSGEPFETVAAEVSEEPGATERGGLLRPGREGTWVDEFWSAASALAPGQVSGVVESPFGFHVLRLEDRTVVPFAEARDRVAREVAELLPSGPFDALRDSVFATLVLEGGTGGWMDAADAHVVASWPGGSYTAGSFRRWVSGGSAAAERGARGGNETVLLEAALEAALTSHANGLELAADERSVASELDDWRVAAQGWAATLGLVGASGAEEIAERALAALGATGQNATVARSALTDERGPLLRSLYETETSQAPNP